MGRLLRRWADHIDPQHAPRKSGYSYTVEGGWVHNNPNGIAVHVDGTGCPFWIMSDDDRERAYTEAATDWRSPAEKLNDVFTKFGQALAEGAGDPARAYGGLVLPAQPMPYDPYTQGPIQISPPREEQ